MILHFEVISKFQEAADADHLLYTPIHAGLSSRHSRVYAVEVEGDADKAREYLLSVLVDQIAQEVGEKAEPLLHDALFILDYGMKAGALDLEKEAILTNYRGRKGQPNGLPFSLGKLTITQRVYVFGKGDKEALSAHFAKDVCNPAIHHWTVA